MKKVLFAVLSIFLIFFIAQPCWAIVITHLDGLIYAETGTNYLGVDESVSSNGWPNTNNVVLSSDNYYGLASGVKTFGPTDDASSVSFMLSSTAVSYSNGQEYNTYALVRSGNDMLKFRLDPGPGEKIGMGVELSASTFIGGTLHSIFGGSADIDFIIEIYKDKNEDPIISFSYYDLVEHPISDWEEMPGFLDEETIYDFFVGDIFYLNFNQIVNAGVTDDPDSKAFAYAVKSTNDVITIAIEAQAIPEPSIIILLGSLIIGVGFLERKRYSGLY